MADATREIMLPGLIHALDMRARDTMLVTALLVNLSKALLLVRLWWRQQLKHSESEPGITTEFKITSSSRTQSNRSCHGNRSVRTRGGRGSSSGQQVTRRINAIT